LTATKLKDILKGVVQGKLAEREICDRKTGTQPFINGESLDAQL
jgi:hypothetical protein